MRRAARRRCSGQHGLDPWQETGESVRLGLGKSTRSDPSFSPRSASARSYAHCPRRERRRSTRRRSVSPGRRSTRPPSTSAAISCDSVPETPSRAIRPERRQILGDRSCAAHDDPGERLPADPERGDPAVRRLRRPPWLVQPAAERCEGLFARRGHSAVFLARLLPLARTFVSLPAGHARIPFIRFLPLTLAGCAIWCAAFVAAGDAAGAGWHEVASAAGRVTLAVSAALLLALATSAGGRGRHSSASRRFRNRRSGSVRESSSAR